MKTNFSPNTQNQNTQVLANYLPSGLLFFAKNIGDSKLRKLLKGLAGELTRFQNKVYELSTEYDLSTTTNLIEEWESALGIPDECLTNTGTIAQRRLQIVAKFAKMNLLTEADWIALAKYFGYDISIEYGTTASLFPMTFPIYFSGTIQAAKFTMIITFLNLDSPTSAFTLTFPFVFGEENFMICLFEHLKPANVNIIYRYRNTP